MKKILIIAICLLAVAVVIASTVSESVLRDGTGKSYYGKIDKDNRLTISAVTDTKIHDASVKGDAYSWTSDTNNINATDTALCVVNQSATRKLVIDSIYVWTDLPTAIQVHTPAGYAWTCESDPDSGGVITGVNLNRTSANVAEVLAYKDETGNTQGVIIVTLHTNELGTDQFATTYDFGDSVVLNYNQAIAVDIVSETAALQCTIVGYFID